MVRYRRKKGHRKAHPVKTRDPLDRWGDDIEKSTKEWGKYTEKSINDLGDWFSKQEKKWTKSAQINLAEKRERKRKAKKKLTEYEKPLPL